MEEIKLFGRTCPNCNKIYKTKEFVKVVLGSNVQVNLTCENGHKWSEFYSLVYNGYWYSGKKYDSHGQEIAKEE